ncbi:MAG: fibronectin/fibrinogen-binding protein [Firmicutes bacterium]|nr:fibronectin/fibrinogen-binding protein [Bacillota bacterium]
MPLDGVVANCIAFELNDKLAGGRVVKIFQPEREEIYLHVWSRGTNFKLLLSANPSYPRIHLTDISKENPSNPPVFCMLLRKHLSGGKILGVELNDFERIFTINIESVNELGIISVKKLIIEIMGRHSNIILVNENDKIIDSIKHVDKEISRVREVMPAREYVLPPSQNKASPLVLDIDNLIENAASTGNLSIEKYLLNSIKGFSPFLCREICFIAGVDEKTDATSVAKDKTLAANLKNAVYEVVNMIKNKDYKPCIVYKQIIDLGSGKDQNPLDFHCLPIRQYSNVKYFNSISFVLDKFYSDRDFSERLRQKKSSLAKIIDVNLERCRKKLAIQQDTLRDVANREKLKLYGELITAFIHSIPLNSKKVSLPNYYSPDNEYVDIELDENKTPQENAQIYFKRYNKAKSTYYNTSKQIEETMEELQYLESVLHLLDNCTSLTEVEEIKEELIEQGYITVKSKKPISRQKKAVGVSKPLHFKSSDGFDIYVGKNNKQNDFLTCKFAGSKDMWLHVKNIPSSHTIIKCHKNEIPESTLAEAASIAAWHSKASRSSNVPVDYTLVKYVKKYSGAKPGMVIYENFKTIFVTPDENLVKRLQVGK